MSEYRKSTDEEQKEIEQVQEKLLDVLTNVSDHRIGWSLILGMTILTFQESGYQKEYLLKIVSDLWDNYENG